MTGNYQLRTRTRHLLHATGLWVIFLILSACDSSSPSGTVVEAVPEPNSAPEVDAGEDQKDISEGNTVSLSGSGTDAEGNVASYLWEQISGPGVTLINADTVTASFEMPFVDSASDLVFQLRVTDADGATATDAVTITVTSKYEAADGINGGRLYSKFWAEETGFSLRNSNLQTQEGLDAITSRSNFFRCKQCHGWDRLGRVGGYSNRGPKTSRPNVADLNLQINLESSSTKELFDAIKTGSVARRDINTDLSAYDPAVDPSIGDLMPDYSQILTDDQIWDLVKYFKQDSIDTSQLYDITLDDEVYPSRGRVFSNIGMDGDAANGDAIFANICAACHGDDGRSIMVDGGGYTLGGHLRAKPYEDQHKVKFGHLGSTMGAILRNNPTSDIKDLYKALADEARYPTDPRVFANASGINGGRLYSKFWATETAFTLENSNLQSQEELDNISSFSNFFRCKQCHGWDLLGRDGGYSNRAPKSSRPNIADLDLAALSASSSTQELFDAIKSGTDRRDISASLADYDPATNTTSGDKMPDYSQILTDEQIWDLVNYLKEEANDTTELYDITLGEDDYPDRGRSFSNIGKDGDAFNGDVIYAINCAVCHGSDGTLIYVDGGAYTVGGHVRAKPYEDQHKVKFGNLGSSMEPILAESPIEDIRDLFKALSNSDKYPTDPAELDGANGINGGRLYSKFWAEETGFTLTNSNLISQAELDGISSNSNFFRCKQCHGWDRLGREGGYSNRAPKTSRPNVADLDLAAISSSSSSLNLFDAIKRSGADRRDVNADLSGYDPDVNPDLGDLMPDYGQILTDDQIWDLVNYLQNEANDTTQLYDITLDNGTYPSRGRTFSNIGLDGNAANGNAIFAGRCALCHGATGTDILVDGGTYTVGAHMRAKPYEDQHKVKFGHLGSEMTAILANSPLSDIKDLLRALTDTTAFPD